jgi:hypothetical protein
LEEDTVKQNTILLFFSAIAFLSCKDLGVQPPSNETDIVPPLETEYYWAGGNKIELTLNRKTVIAVYKPDSTHPNRWLEIIYFEKYQLAPLRSVVAARGFNPDQFEWLSFGYTYLGGEVLPTNRISFSLRPEYTLHSLDTLINNDAVFDSTKFGTVMLKVVQQEGNVFHIANRLQESGLVDYSTPDFIVRITHAD